MSKQRLLNFKTAPEILSVSQFTLQMKELLEKSFPEVHVAGEVSNLARPQSGHCYLTLKDDQAQLRGVIWRNTARRIPFDLKDGMEVICQGHVDLYAPRGSYQLVIENIVPKGIGSLELALRQLREKLTAEGLFDAKHKKPLPSFPRRVAFVTSATGAAIHDFLEVVSRRWKALEVLVVPVRVQGEQAAGEIAAAIATVNQMPQPPEVIIVGRGGGSVEDLWSFNEEAVVRAIFASKIPVISAVGHEIDVTLSDLVADVRALTPSEAAELVVPDVEEVLQQLRYLQSRLTGSIKNRIATHRSELDFLANVRAFRRPFSQIQEYSQRLDQWQQRSDRAIRHRVALSQKSIASIAASLQSLSPLNVLSRGYSITQDKNTGESLKDIKQLEVGQSVITRLDRGNFVSKIEQIEPANSQSDKSNRNET